MFELSFPEMAVIAVLAIMLIGPKELPVIFRSAAGFYKKFRTTWREVKQQFDLTSELDGFSDLHKELQDQAHFIKDEQGKLYQAYDISDVVDASRKPKPSAQPALEAAETNTTPAADRSDAKN